METLFVEKYRPKKLEDAILPKAIKETFENIIKNDDIPNLLLVGSSGTGKTTVAKILCEALDYEYLYINASNEGRSIDTVRTTITDFATSTSLSGKKKVVLLDEFCGCSNVVQDALKGFFEQYSTTCAFILTANHRHKINAPILSRFSEITFKIPAEERKDLAVGMLKRIMTILDIEQITYDKAAIAELIKRYFPDFRKVLNELQKFSVSKRFDMDSLAALETPTTKIVEFLKEKNFKELRKLVATMANLDINAINRELYDKMYDFIKPASIPTLVIIMADYNYKSAFSQDQEINIMAEFTEIMGNVEFV